MVDTFKLPDPTRVHLVQRADIEHIDVVRLSDYDALDARCRDAEAKVAWLEGKEIAVCGYPWDQPYQDGYDSAKGEYQERIRELGAALDDIASRTDYDRDACGKRAADALAAAETPVYPYQQPSGLPAQTSTTGVHPNGGPCIHVWALTNRDAVENGRCGICGQSVANRSVKP